MAFQMSISKIVPFQSSPLVYPNAYWVASFDKLDPVAKVAEVRFSAYADKTTREAGNVQPVANHIFTVSGVAYTTYFGTAATTSENVYAQAYAMAKATTDPSPRVAIPKSSPTPRVFFADAVNV